MWVVEITWHDGFHPHFQVFPEYRHWLGARILHFSEGIEDPRAGRFSLSRGESLRFSPSL
jgi:hypothetical protein